MRRPKPHGTGPDSGIPPAQWLFLLRRVLPPLFLLLVVLLAMGELRRLDLPAIRSSLQSVGAAGLLGLQCLGLVSVLSMCLYDRFVASVFRVEIATGILVRSAWIANTFSNLVGLGGLTGSGIRLLLLRREKVDTRRAAAFSMLIVASVPTGLTLLALATLLMGAPAVGQLPIPAWVAWLALGIFMAYLPAYIVALRGGFLSRRLRQLPRLPARAIATLIAISMLDWLLAATTAWAALYLSGADIVFMQFLPAFVLASIVGMLSMIPGSLGVFDASLALLLSSVSGNPEAIISGLLLYRLCYYLVPWLVGLFLAADRLTLARRWPQSALARHWRDSALSGFLRLPLDSLASLGVRALGYLTFGAGLILLVSAAFPALEQRINFLRDYLPLAAIEISHLLSVAAGVMLIALSRGIAEQVRSAYYLTQGLLVGGALFSMLKGIDYEEALSLLTVALLLRQQRSHFYRLGYPFFCLRTLIWLAGLALSVIGFAWLGDWVHGEIPLAWTPLSQFAPHLDAPRFARGLLVAATAATVFIGWSFYRRPDAALPRPGAAQLAEAEALLQRHGGSNFAHLLFLGDKYLQWSPDRTAFIQYGQIRQRLVALGDPCGDPEAFESVILAFRDHADMYGFTPCFYEVGQARVHLYHDAGFKLFKLGESAVVDLAEFTTGGKRGEPLRSSANRARRAGARFELLEQPLDDALWPQLKAVSDDWLAAVGSAEKGFSLGFYDQAYLRRSAIGVILLGRQVVAFANLMPDYGAQRMLSIDLMRYSAEAPAGTMDMLLTELLLHAKNAGYRRFDLGMAPLGGVGLSRYAHPGERLAHLVFEHGNRLYHYKGLRSYKEKFHPEWHSVYLAYPRYAPLPTLLIDIAALISGSYRGLLLGEPKPTGRHQRQPQDP